MPYNNDNVTAGGYLRTWATNIAGILSLFGAVAMIIDTHRLEKNKRDFSAKSLPENLPTAAANALKIKPYALFGMGLGLSIAVVLIALINHLLLDAGKNSSKVMFLLEMGAALGMTVQGVLMVFTLRYHGEDNLFLYPDQTVSQGGENYDTAIHAFRFAFFPIFTSAFLCTLAFIIHAAQLCVRGGRSIRHFSSRRERQIDRNGTNCELGGGDSNSAAQTYEMTEIRPVAESGPAREAISTPPPTYTPYKGESSGFADKSAGFEQNRYSNTRSSQSRASPWTTPTPFYFPSVVNCDVSSDNRNHHSESHSGYHSSSNDYGSSSGGGDSGGCGGHGSSSGGGGE